MQIKSKSEFVALSEAGKLGNFLKSYLTLDALNASGYRGFLTIRSKDKQSPHFVPVTNNEIKRCKVCSEIALQHDLELLRKQGARLEDLYFQQIPDPAAKRVANFEAMLTLKGMGAFIEFDTTEPVRGIRDRAKWYEGLDASITLQTRLSPESYDVLGEIWWQYPTAVIEAVEFSQPTGEFNKQLVVFEVRDY